MLPKDFENYELKFKKLQEDSREHYNHALKIFEQEYQGVLDSFLPDDVLGILGHIRTHFCVTLAESLGSNHKVSHPSVIQKSIQEACSMLPLSFESVVMLSTGLINVLQQQGKKPDFLRDNSDLKKDPIFPMLEDIFVDGKISAQEIILLESYYSQDTKLQTHITKLPEKSRNIIQSELGDMTQLTLLERQTYFEQAYQTELGSLQQRGYQTQLVSAFVSKSYYVPKKRFETSDRRLRRTWKIALLRLLKYRFGNIDIEALLKQFDTCQTFEDFFLLLYKLFEILGEDTEVHEVFVVEEKKHSLQDIILTAKQRKEKILSGEKVTAKISDIISQTDAQLEFEVLGALLQDDTHFLGEDIYFAHSDTLAGIYAETIEKESEDEDIEDIIQSVDTLLGKYEALKAYFFELDTQKRRAFGLGDYEEIDRLNEILFRLESQIQKLSQLLGEGTLTQDIVE